MAHSLFHAGLEFAPLQVVAGGPAADAACSLQVLAAAGLLGLIGAEQEDRTLVARTRLARRVRRSDVHADCQQVLWELAGLIGLHLRLRVDERDTRGVAVVRRLWPGQPEQPVWIPDARCGGRVCLQWDVRCPPTAGTPLDAGARGQLRALVAATPFGRRLLVGPEPLALTA